VKPVEWYELHGPLVRHAAKTHGLDHRLLCALVQHESKGHWDAHNPEPRFHWLVDVRTWEPFRVKDGHGTRLLTPAEVLSPIPPKGWRAPADWIDPDAEWWAQKQSWGLCQVMGAVARENGYHGLFIPGILDPATNLDLGARILAGKIERHGGNVRLGLLAFNGGGDLDYPDKVLKHVDEFPI